MNCWDKFIQIMFTLQLGFICFMNHMVNSIIYTYVLQFIHVSYTEEFFLMFQQMLGDYITLYSLLFSFNILKHVPFKDSCIPMTLHTPHWKFIVNKQNFKWNYHSLPMIPYILYLICQIYKWFSCEMIWIVLMVQLCDVANVIKKRSLCIFS